MESELDIITPESEEGAIYKICKQCQKKIFKKEWFELNPKNSCWNKIKYCSEY
jgi:hypothetical protein